MEDASTPISPIPETTSPQLSPSPVMKKERGKFLWILLLLTVVGIVQSFTSVFIPSSSEVEKMMGPNPSWYPIYVWYGLVSGIIITVGIYLWKKWAVYFLIFNGIVGSILQFFLPPIALAPLTIVVIALGLAIWFLAIKPKWHYFE